MHLFILRYDVMIDLEHSREGRDSIMQSIKNGEWNFQYLVAATFFLLPLSLS
jgi:hypothetical protein